MMAVAELFFQHRIRRIQTLNGEKSPYAHRGFEGKWPEYDSNHLL